MDSYEVLIRRARREFDAGEYHKCDASLTAAKAIRRNAPPSKAETDAWTRAEIDRIGKAVGHYDPSLANRDATGLPPTSGGNSLRGKTLIEPPTIKLGDNEAFTLHRAATGRSTARVELKARLKVDPSGPIIGQPPAIVPRGVAPLPFAREPSRILNLIPLAVAPGPYLQYFATAGGTAAAAVAEGQPKPESFPRWARIDARATKIAHYVEASDESITDFPNFLTITEDDLMNGVIDAENRELLSAVTDATVHGWNGLLHTPGTLSRTRTTETPLDCLEQAINDLRVGPAFTPATGIVLHPTDWSGIRRSKDSQNRYLATNPLDGAANTLWGVPIVQTSQIAVGTALVANFAEGCLAYSVENMRLEIDRGGEAFKANLTVVRCEERLILTVPRPAAICHVDGL